jgi:hypothetical protein
MSPLSSAVARFAQHHLTRDNSNQPYSIRAEQQPALMAAVGKFIAKLTPRAASPSVAAPAAAAPSSSAAPVLCSSSRDTAMVRGLVSMIVTWPSLIRQQCTRPPNGPSVSCKQERQVQCEVYEFIRAAGLSCGIGIGSADPDLASSDRDSIADGVPMSSAAYSTILRFLVGQHAIADVGHILPDRVETWACLSSSERSV